MKGKSTRSILTAFVLLISISAFAQQTADDFLKRGKSLFDKKDFLGAG